MKSTRALFLDRSNRESRTGVVSPNQMTFYSLTRSKESKPQLRKEKILPLWEFSLKEPSQTTSVCSNSPKDRSQTSQTSDLYF